MANTDQSDQPTAATRAFRNKVMRKASKDTRYTELSDKERPAVWAGLRAYRRPLMGNPRERVHEAIEAKSEELKISDERSRELVTLANTLLTRGFVLTQAGYGPQKKAKATNVVAFNQRARKASGRGQRQTKGHRGGQRVAG